MLDEDTVVEKVVAVAVVVVLLVCEEISEYEGGLLPYQPLPYGCHQRRVSLVITFVTLRLCPTHFQVHLHTRDAQGARSRICISASN